MGRVGGSGPCRPQHVVVLATDLATASRALRRLHQSPAAGGVSFAVQQLVVPDLREDAYAPSLDNLKRDLRRLRKSLQRHLTNALGGAGSRRRGAVTTNLAFYHFVFGSAGERQRQDPMEPLAGGTFPFGRRPDLAPRPTPEEQRLASFVEPAFGWGRRLDGLRLPGHRRRGAGAARAAPPDPGPRQPREQRAQPSASVNEQDESDAYAGPDDFGPWDGGDDYDEGSALDELVPPPPSSQPLPQRWPDDVTLSPAARLHALLQPGHPFVAHQRRCFPPSHGPRSYGLTALLKQAAATSFVFIVPAYHVDTGASTIGVSATSWQAVVLRAPHGAAQDCTLGHVAHCGQCAVLRQRGAADPVCWAVLAVLRFLEEQYGA